MSAGGANQTVGSVIVQDSKFPGTKIGVVTGYSTSANVPATGGTLILDNVDFSNCPTGVADAKGNSVLAGGSKVASWAQGKAYTSDSSAADKSVSVHGPLTAVNKPTSLLDSSGSIFERSRPQYENVPASSFVSIKSKGAKGDGSTDDTKAIQSALDSATADQIVYFDHGAYLITSTIKVPKNVKITGEMWPLIMASGKAAAFSDASKPTPVFQIGQPGDKGAVEMSDIIFETKGNAPGAVLIEWNMQSSSPGSSGLWDVHVRIGGSAGTGLQSDQCTKNPNATATDVDKCKGAFTMLHVTKKASLYLENNWFWVADHELDRPDHNQIDIYNGRGVLIESQEGPVWMYGTSSEHSQLYNYQIANAHNIYAGVIQTETPYMQSNPVATTAFPPQTALNDPTFSTCTTNACKKAWGLRVLDSSNVLIYGAGLYRYVTSSALSDSLPLIR